jgi:hypothetical protein
MTSIVLIYCVRTNHDARPKISAFQLRARNSVTLWTGLGPNGTAQSDNRIFELLTINEASWEEFVKIEFRNVVAVEYI